MQVIEEIPRQFTQYIYIYIYHLGAYFLDRMKLLYIRNGLLLDRCQAFTWPRSMTLYVVTGLHWVNHISVVMLWYIYNISQHMFRSITCASEIHLTLIIILFKNDILKISVTFSWKRIKEDDKQWDMSRLWKNKSMSQFQSSKWYFA